MVRIAAGRHVLITGGAGFIGSHLTDRLLAEGHRVRILDNLSPQVHGPDQRPPEYLNRDAELVVGDILDDAAVRRALDGVDAVVHLAAMVGVGQSMYELAEYTRVNCLGTAVLLQAMIERPVERLLVASSMSIYGEGRYRSNDEAAHDDINRSTNDLRGGRWEPHNEQVTTLRPVPTPESKRPSLASIYALTKYDQEQMCLITGRAYGISTAALRLFNVYGPRQALSNPYTGVLANFLARLQNENPPLIYEDGLQQRDFVHVHDVASAFERALARPDVADVAINIGSGRHYTILEIANAAIHAIGRSDISPQITGQYRVGDVRHCYADISLARRALEYSPRVSLSDGLADLCRWLDGQVALDRVEAAQTELQSRGLTA